MSIFLAWTSEPCPLDLSGPWEEIRVAAPGLVFIDSTETRSRVYHELKWALPEDTALLVTRVTTLPKSKGLTHGTQSWLRDRITD